MGGIQKRIYLVEHPQGLGPLRNIRGLLRTQAATSIIPTQNIGWERKQRDMEARGNRGFSDGSSSDRLTEEQENEIAENIYDWWISGKSYKQWYAEKFQQMKLDFGEF